MEEPVNCPNVSRISCKYALIFQGFLQFSVFPVWDRINNTGFWRQFTVQSHISYLNNYNNWLYILAYSWHSDFFFLLIYISWIALDFNVSLDLASQLYKLQQNSQMRLLLGARGKKTRPSCWTWEPRNSHCGSDAYYSGLLL